MTTSGRPTIVLLTDFGTQDAYAGILKGVIRGICPQAAILDLTHGIEPQNILRGAILLQDACAYFPQGSIFVCVVDPGVGTSRKAVAVRTPHFIFVGPDNGLLQPAEARQKSVEIREIKNAHFFRDTSKVSATFHGRDIFAPAAARLAAAPNTFRQIGPRLKSLHSANIPKISRRGSDIHGQILAFDYYGNAITNIGSADIPAALKKTGRVLVGGQPAGRILKTYGQGRRGLMALMNSFGRLEIAFPNGSARVRGNLNPFDPVVIAHAPKS